MSTTVESSAASWRKRHRDDDSSSPKDSKRARSYYYRLESESSKASEEDTESVYSLQDRETDVVRDTSDTDSKSDCSEQDEYEVIEYEVASLSESDNESHLNSSSGSEDVLLAAAAAVICDSSLETWITDGEESDNSSLEETSLPRTGFTTCIQCKSENNNPLYTYCEKCFQDRKKFFPPRPRGNRKTRKTKKPDAPVKLDLLRSCLSGLSQDSGIGSSQECPPLDFDQIIVPDKHLRAGTSQNSSITEKLKVKDDQNEKLDTITSMVSPGLVDSSLKEDACITHTQSKLNSKNRKRYISESSLSDYEVKKPKFPKLKVDKKPLSLGQTSDMCSEISSSSFNSEKLDLEKNSGVENSELCMFCNNAPKDSIFLHTNIAHQCCCYKCAKRTLQTIKRCPMCNRSVNKVVRIFTS